MVPSTLTSRSNRKRVRHRTRRNRSQRDDLQWRENISKGNTPTTANSSLTYESAPMRASCPLLYSMTILKRSPTLLRRETEESAEARDRSWFGGVDEDSQSARDLRGPMLDVVLALFNGVDYDDSLC